MILTVLTVIAVFAILVVAEYLSRAKQIHAELTRKFVHVVVGTFVAFWPFFLSWGQIQFLAASFFVVICISAKLNIFHSIHNVQRNVVGEILFAVVIFVLALISTNEWVFTAAMLHLSLADGLAAIIGLGWGDTNTYKVLGRTKSIAGSAAFLITSFAVLMVFDVATDASTSFFTLLWLPVLATAAENIAVYGTDNLVMPLMVAAILSSGI